MDAKVGLWVAFSVFLGGVAAWSLVVFGGVWRSLALLDGLMHAVHG